MSQYNVTDFQSLSDALREYFNKDLHSLAYDDENSNKKFKEIGIPTYTVEDSYGGTDMGIVWWKVLLFDNGMYLKISGEYYSYDGVNFYAWEDCVSQVKPVDKVITDWVDIVVEERTDDYSPF